MIKLVDKDGKEFTLYDEVWHHICRFHPEIDNVDILEQVLRYPDAVIRSDWDVDSILYYKKRGYFYTVVVVQMKDMRIKTTLTERRIKEGEILWLNPNLLT